MYCATHSPSSFILHLLPLILSCSSLFSYHLLTSSLPTNFPFLPSSIFPLLTIFPTCLSTNNMFTLTLLRSPLFFPSIVTFLPFAFFHALNSLPNSLPPSSRLFYFHIFLSPSLLLSLPSSLPPIPRGRMSCPW